MKNTKHWNFKEARWDTEKEYLAGDFDSYVPKNEWDLNKLNQTFQITKNGISRENNTHLINNCQ